MAPSEAAKAGQPKAAQLDDGGARKPCSEQAVNPPQALVAGPRHYHLLWDEELELLRPYLKLIVERLGDVIEHWYQLYVLHFGDQRTLSEPEFREVFAPALARETQCLLDGDMDRYTIETIRAGEGLCERRVPFAEVVASL